MIIIGLALYVYVAMVWGALNENTGASDSTRNRHE